MSDRIEQIDRRIRDRWTSAAGLVVFCIVGLGTLAIKVLTDPSAALSPDSTMYLQLAESFAAGHPMVINIDGRGVAVPEYYAIFPPLYPALIALVWSVTGHSVFVASKLLNAALWLIAAVTIVRTFGRHRWPLVLLLLSAQIAALYTMTWSEAPFSLLLLMFASRLGRPDGGTLWAALQLLALSVCLFLTRYIGLFAVVPVSLFAFQDWRAGRFVEFRSKLCVVAATLLIATGVLLANWHSTGFITGMSRPAAVESNYQMLEQTVAAVAHQAVFFSINPDLPGWVVLLALCALVALAVFMVVPGEAGREAAKELVVDGHDRRMIATYAVTGGTYLSAIIVMRWMQHFDPLGYRLLTPGTLLIFLAGGAAAWNAGPSRRLVLFAYLALNAVALTMLSARHLADAGGTGRAGLSLELVAERYAQIPRGSIVVQGDQRVHFLRPDLFLTIRETHPDVPQDEDWCGLLQSLDGRRQVFVDFADKSLPSLARLRKCGVAFVPLSKPPAVAPL